MLLLAVAKPAGGICGRFQGSRVPGWMGSQMQQSPPSHQTWQLSGLGSKLILI